MNFTRKIILFSILALHSASFKGQSLDLNPNNKEGLTIDAIINEAGNRSQNAGIIIYKNNTPVDSAMHLPKGKLKLELPYHPSDIYTLEIKSKGLISKRISFYTEVPYYFTDDRNFDFEVNLIPKPDQPVNHIDYEFPVAIVKFNLESLEFNYIESYTAGMLYDEKKLRQLIYN